MAVQLNHHIVMVRRQANHHDGGRGVYFRDPNGHLLEIITRPYGGGQYLEQNAEKASRRLRSRRRSGGRCGCRVRGCPLLQRRLDRTLMAWEKRFTPAGRYRYFSSILR